MNLRLSTTNWGAAVGAKRVYLVEPEPVVQLAHELARANGLADRIVVLQGKMEAVELPEKVDLILKFYGIDYPRDYAMLVAVRARIIAHQQEINWSNQS